MNFTGHVACNHQLHLVRIRMLLEIRRQITMAVIWTDKRRYGETIQVEHNTEEWRNIRMVQEAPDVAFPYEFLLIRTEFESKKTKWCTVVCNDVPSSVWQYIRNLSKRLL